MSVTEEKKTEAVVAPFGIEADHHTNSDLLIQAIPGCRLRSALRPRPVKDRKTGNMMISADQAAVLGKFPPVPGMQLHVNPAKLTYTIIDPLNDDEQLCDRIRQAINASSVTRVSGKLHGVETVKGKLDVHRMKTLVRELRWLLDSEDVKEVNGKVPEMEDIEELPGNFLLNPGARIPNSQPVFEKDWDAWVQNLTRVGG